MKDEDAERAALIASAREVIEGHGAPALAGRSLEEAARSWIDAGFEDTEEIDEWLSARCFKAEVAERLDGAGITPEQAAMRTRAGSAPYEESIAYKVAAGDLSLDEARRIITAAFWDS